MNRMREFRKLKKMTMKELGKTVGVSESTISLYETGKHEPDLATIGKIADVLDVSVDCLLGRDEQEKETPEKGLQSEKLINLISELSPENRARAEAYLDGLLAGQANQ